uniref:Uncharacterized protein n=1 Tax=Rhizophora mucronata TaxID=61149 RepID=A0A2P2R3K4_RHIMU
MCMGAYSHANKFHIMAHCNLRWKTNIDQNQQKLLLHKND